MKLPHAVASGALLLLGLESSAQTPVASKDSVLPRAAAEIIEQTPCPSAAAISVEACLLLLAPRSVNTADDIARDRGRGKAPATGAEAAIASGFLAPETEPDTPSEPPQDPR